MTTLTYLHEIVIPAAYDLLPPEMASKEATAMLLAIALQESDQLQARTQYGGGPARGFWQFEKGGGVTGVLTHPISREHIFTVLETLVYPPLPQACYAAIEHNDVLAACFARLLLWTLPVDLPGSEHYADSWGQYLDAWRPGKPHPDTWEVNYRRAWRIVEHT